MNREDFHREMLRSRGVVIPCEKCRGAGVHSYSSGATWRGGAGTASFEWDVCDRCWGSGDEHRHGLDLRELTAQRAKWEEDQVHDYLQQRLGIGLGGMRRRVNELADFCGIQSRRRKIPEKESAFWWSHNWTELASILRKLADGGS